MENLNNVENELLKKITDTDDFSGGAYNIRQNGKGVSRKTTENINIVNKEDKPGIDIIVKPGTKKDNRQRRIFRRCL